MIAQAPRPRDGRPVSFLDSFAAVSRSARRRLWACGLLGCWLMLVGLAAQPAPVERRDQRWGLASFAADAGLLRQNIFQFAFEASGTIWVAASDGLFRYDGYTWTRFGVEQGLPSRFVRTVLVTRAGELWVGTSQGAGVFDGHRFDSRGSETGLAGPSVRRIREDPDGTLWFASDRWPDASVNSGLTRWRAGVWTQYRTADGLPSDHVYDCFRDSAGRHFALTSAGIAEWDGKHWAAPENGEVLAGTECRSMVESPRLGLVARSGATLFVRRDGRWQRNRLPGSRFTNPAGEPLATTRTGEVLTADFDGSRFGVFTWTGDDVVSISPAMGNWAMTAEYLAEAPDGAIWYCHYGTLVRWERSGREWIEYENLAFPRLVDRDGHVWFADSRQAQRWDGRTFTAVPELAGPIAVDGQGHVIGWSADGVVKRANGAIRTFGPEVTGLRRIFGHILDAQGRSWFDGEDPSGASAAAVFDGARWMVVPLGVAPQPAVDRAADPSGGGVWFLTREPDGRHVSVLHTSGSAVEKATLEYGAIPNTPPHLAVDPTGVLWLSGQSGLYRLERSTRAWTHVRAIPGNDIDKGVVRGDEIWFPFTGWTGGESGFACYRAGSWHAFTADYSDLLTATPDGRLYVGTEQGLEIVPAGPTALPSQLTLPQGQRVHTLVRDREGTLWLGVVQPDGTGPSVLRYRSDGIPPQTELVAASGEVRRDRLFVVSATARERFTPRGQARSMQFSWRFDDGEWSRFGDMPAEGLSVAALPTGSHRVEVRARDEGFDVDPTPATQVFRVLPVPLQERSWFRGAVLTALVAILALAIVAAERARRLAGVNVQLHSEIAERRRAERSLQTAHDELEQRVTERTAELSAANTRLQSEVAERERAQADLQATQNRLIDASRQAGMAEVATSVLHNVGNVLNSVNVSASLVTERLRESRVANLTRIVEMLRAHPDDLAAFLTGDPKGRRIPEYLEALARDAAAAQSAAADELEQLRAKIEHIKQIVAMQQSYATVSGVVEPLPLVDLVEEAIRLNAGSLARHHVEIRREFEANPVALVDRHKLMQLLVNLIRNAKEACDAAGHAEKQITITLAQEAGTVWLAIADNGVGIARENLTRIFSHGFTTKPKGHGFGLHNSALIARELGGALVAASPGPDAGATFTLTLPVPA
jgi:signal transduction histidine kinase